MRLLIIHILLFTSFVKADFVVNSRLLEAQQFISQLQLEKGRILVEKEKRENPNNYASILVENYIDLYQILAAQNQTEYQKLLPNRDKRLAILIKIKSNDPYLLYSQAEIHLQWAFAKSQYGDFLSAALDFRAAYQLLQKNAILFPKFIYNNKDLGILKVIISTIPDGYQWIINIAGMKGNFDEGMLLLKNFISLNNDQSLLIENQNAKLLFCLFKVNFDKDKTITWKLTEKYTNDYETNLMSNCIRAFIAGRCDMTDEGIKNLVAKPHTKDYIPFYFTDYLLGSLKLCRLDEDASYYLKRFTSFSANKDLYQEAYTKLAWSCILKGDTQNYYVYAGLAYKFNKNENKKWLSIASQGSTSVIPNVQLLKIRLLTDGGYYTKAEQELGLIKTNSLVTEIEKTEYFYRSARLYHETNKYQKAIDNYNSTIKIGSNLPLHFAANSCLQMGFIYEKMGYKESAINFYNKALEYDNYQNKYGIQQKAKAAINKIQKT